MISIIISSYRENLYLDLVQNIAETIGDLDFELIKIDNPGIMGICKAYNRGAKIAKYNYLLFLHEDIKFLKKGWGIELRNLYNLDNLGIIGIAGGLKKSSLPTGHDQGIDNYRCVFVIQEGNRIPGQGVIREPIKTKTLDGIFLAMTKKRWEEIKFNEKVEGFHFYDLDISLRASMNYQNYISPNIPVLHFSLGNFGDEWIKSCVKFHKEKYNFDNFSGKEKTLTRKFWYQRLLSEKIRFENRMRYTLNLGIDRGSLRSSVNFLFPKNHF